VFRFTVLATIAVVGLGLAWSPAVAGEPQGEAAKIEKTERVIVPLPNLTHPGRLSTRDRWRGGPYVRSTADERVRSNALNVALPPANSAFQGGTSLQTPNLRSNEDFIRNEALNKALPAFNPAVVGGGSVQGGVGF
jgi:hypothetical protein